MAILSQLGRFFSPAAAAKHSRDKTVRREKRGAKEVEKAQKLGLKQQRRAYDISKDIEKGKYAPETSLKQMRKDLERASRYSGEALAPLKEQAQAGAQQTFERLIRPGAVAQAGAQGGVSSALNQALSASAMDLSSQLENQFSQMQLGLAQGMTGQKYQGQQNRLASVMGLATGQNPIAQQVAAQQPVQRPGIGSFLLPAVGGVLGGLAGGPAGAMAGTQLGSLASQY